MSLAWEFFLFLKRHGYVEETYWTFSYSPIVNDTNDVVGIFVATTDVTSDVVGERRLATVHELGTMSRATLGSLTEAGRAALAVMGQNRPALPFAACYLREGEVLELVASYGVVAGTQAFPLVVALDAPAAIARVVRTGRSQVFDVERLARPGDISPSPLGPAVPSQAMLSALRVSGGRDPVGVLVLGVNPYRGVDQTYRRFFNLVMGQFSALLTDSLANQQERRRAQMLTELHESKTRFFANVSHEFRTPLTLVLGALRPADAGSPRDGQGPDPEAIAAARRAALRLDRLVDALLMFAQAEGGALVAHRQPTDLAALTRDCSAMFRSAVELAGLTLTIDVPPTAAVVDVDPEMWSRIVLNLLSNAYKFTLVGGISVRLRLVDDMVVLAVADTGVGIGADELGRVFERFHQVAGAASRTGPGAGIGLALVADLVSAHDGLVEVVSTPEVGSTFTVRFPSRRTSTEQVSPTVLSDRLRSQVLTELHVSADLPEEDPRVGRGVEGGRQSSGTRRVLVVEDNTDLRRYVVRLLRDDGWDVTQARDAETALTIEAMPEIVLSDVMLPGMDGLALVRILRASPPLNRIPIILLTARAGTRSATEGLLAGADDYIVKPFEPAELLARLAVHHELAALRNFALAEAENHSANLEQALASNRQIGAAIGILMATHKLTSDRAFTLLRETSNKNNRRLRDVADHVVLTGNLH